MGILLDGLRLISGDRPLFSSTIMLSVCNILLDEL